MQLLTQNSDLKKTGIYSWTLPAHWVKLTNGERFNTCPHAGICAAFCYAKNGTYNFPKVKAAHIAKLEMVLYRREQWKYMMMSHLNLPKYRGKYIRIHDSGDFFSRDYAQDWLDIAYMHPQITFYTYTKEVSLFKSLRLPDNFIVIYSFGGWEDHLIDRDKDRHSDVFPDRQAMLDEGYVDISDDDKQAAINPNHRIGLYRNNIPKYIKKMGNKKFSEWTEKTYLVNKIKDDTTGTEKHEGGSSQTPTDDGRQSPGEPRAEDTEGV